jgi:hypothetical protein
MPLDRPVLIVVHHLHSLHRCWDAFGLASACDSPATLPSALLKLLVLSHPGPPAPQGYSSEASLM